MRRRRSRENPVSGLTIALAIGGIAALGVGTYFLLAPSSTPTLGTSWVTTWTNGQTYTFGSPSPWSGYTDAQSLATGLAASGYSNISVWYWKGTGSIPSAISGITTGGYAVTATFTGTTGTPVSSDITAVTGAPTGMTAIATA